MESVDLPCDGELHLGRVTSVVTGSKSGLLSTSHGIALSHSRRVSPLLAGIAEEIALFWGSSRLPDKEFRYLRHCCYPHSIEDEWWSDHFCRSPHVAMRIGLSHHLSGYSGCSAYSL